MLDRMRLRRCWRDRQYHLALVSALVFWALLYGLGLTHPSWHWVVVSPWLFVSLILLQPVLEEVVFRGALQGWLMQQTWGRQAYMHITCANILTSVIFTAMHLLHHAPLMAASVMLPSLLFGYFRDRYEAWLVPSMLLHCFYNLGYFFLYAPVSS